MSIHYLYLLPGPRASAWRHVWASAAAGQGWQVIHHWEAQPPALAGGCNVLVIVAVPLEGDTPGGSWTVIAPEEAMTVVDAVHQELGSSRAVAVGHAMRCLAHAAERVAQGANLTRSNAAFVDTPFGAVCRPEALPQESASAVWPLYSEFPPAEGAASILPQDLFKVPTKTAMEGGDRSIDLTGRGRIIYHGPYVELPSGEWSVRVRFRYEGSGKSSPLRFEWGIGNDVECVDLVVRMSGDYSIDLTHRWNSIDLCQLRIWLYHAVFQGLFEVLEVKIIRGNRSFVPAAVA